MNGIADASENSSGGGAAAGRTPTLLVVSDSHGDGAALAAALAWGVEKGVDALAFLGDGNDDLAKAAERTGFGAPIYAVRGNGDGDHRLSQALTIEFAGRRIFLSHGHLTGVQDGLSSLLAAAESTGAELALFGHTHRPFWEEFRRILILNPGSIGRPRSDAGPSFATIAFPQDQWYIVRFWSVRTGSLGRKAIREFSLQG